MVQITKGSTTIIIDPSDLMSFDKSMGTYDPPAGSTLRISLAMRDGTNVSLEADGDKANALWDAIQSWEARKGQLRSVPLDMSIHES